MGTDQIAALRLEILKQAQAHHHERGYASAREVLETAKEFEAFIRDKIY